MDEHHIQILADQQGISEPTRMLTIVLPSIWGTEGREFKSPQPDNSEGPESQRFWPAVDGGQSSVPGEAGSSVVVGGGVVVEVVVAGGVVVVGVGVVPGMVTEAI